MLPLSPSLSWANSHTYANKTQVLFSVYNIMLKVCCFVKCLFVSSFCLTIAWWSKLQHADDWKMWTLLKATLPSYLKSPCFPASCGPGPLASESPVGCVMCRLSNFMKCLGQECCKLQNGCREQTKLLLQLLRIPTVEQENYRGVKG